jgi:hypothetical protein
MHRQHDHLAARCRGGDAPRRFDTIETRQADVHEDDVGTCLRSQFHGIETVNGFDDVDVRDRLLEKRADAGSHERMIVDDENALTHAATPIGTRHVTVVP